MLDSERARNLAALFNRCGKRWREVVPLDVQVKDATVHVGTAELGRNVDGLWVVTRAAEPFAAARPAAPSPVADLTGAAR